MAYVDREFWPKFITTRADKPVAFTIENKRKAEGETDTRAPAPRRAAKTESYFLHYRDNFMY